MMRLAVVVIAASLLAGCAGTPVSEAVFGPDTGGWEKNWNDTDCSEYLTKMTEREQTAFARWTLTFLRETTLASAPAPSDSMVGQFRQAVADVCRADYTGPDYDLVAAAAVVYSLEERFEPAYR